MLIDVLNEFNFPPTIRHRHKRIRAQLKGIIVKSQSVISNRIAMAEISYHIN